MKAFCIECNKNVNLRIESEWVDIKVRGVDFGYIEKRAYCKECGEEVYSPDINDSNCDAREIAYNKVKRNI